MKILYSPEFSGHVFLGLTKEHAHLMDVMVCDTKSLVGMLELRLGIHVDELLVHYRTVKYFKAMSEYMKGHPQNALAASFKLSSLGTAEEALRWRDSLMLDKWHADDKVSDSARLDVLVGTESFFDSPGLPDRLMRVIDQLKKEKRDFFNDLEIELPCSMDFLHPAIQELLSELRSCGATFSLRRWGQTGGNIENENNLRQVSHLLHSDAKSKIKLNKEDPSFLIYRFNDEKAANEFMAMKGEQLNVDLWINNANKTMDNWLRMMGKPTMGSSMDKASPQVLQLFVLSIDMMKEPLNIHSLIGWLYSPMQPLGTFFGGILADTIIKEGGYRNDKCRQVVVDYIEGKFTYHDKEEDKKLSSVELSLRATKEKKARKILVDTYLPPFEATDENRINSLKLKVYLNSLSSWAKTRAHLLHDKKDQEGWCSQLESLAQMCETFVLLLDSSDTGEYIEAKQVDSWISTLYKGESFMQYAPQKGSRELIDNPARMAAHSRRTVWMNFIGDEAKHLDCSFLYPTERENIKHRLAFWDEQKERHYHQTMQRLPFLMTDEQLILVITDYTAGEPSPKHPIMVRLETQIENIGDFVVTPHLLDESMKDVVMVANQNAKPLIPFQHADKLKWPEHMSPTVISTLVEYPLDYMMQYLLDIVNTGPGSIPELKTTKGTVAHAVIESLFAPRNDEPRSTADEIQRRITEEFDWQVNSQIESCGAILYLPENRLEAQLLKEQLRRCLDVLLQILRDNRLTVTGCERLVRKDLQLLHNSKGWDMVGYIDMTLEDDMHHPVVFDFKWTSSRTYYRELLSANRSTQLELYRLMLGSQMHDEVQRTAYFLMPEGHLYSKEHFEGLHCTQMQPENTDNIVEQLRRSFFYRKQQIDNGTVEVGENFPADMLDYYNDTEKQQLFPLSLDATGQEKMNIFSNYTLFK